MSKTKILIVDDDAKLSHLLAIILSRVGGHEVREENRPFAAVHTAREFSPDLILLDVDMPGKDGGEISEDLSGDPLLAQVPVIFVTSLITRGEAGMRKGHPFLAKPIDPMLLLQTVRCLCQRVPAQAAA
jgi:DNA-binding response OmpR family regulator